MKRFICLLLLCVPLFALELTLNSGKEGGKSFSVLRLSHSEPFACQEFYNRFSEIEKVVCSFKGTFDRGFRFERMLFFKIDAFQDNENAVVVITPKKRQNSLRSTKTQSAPHRLSKSAHRLQLIGRLLDTKTPCHS